MRQKIPNRIKRVKRAKRSISKVKRNGSWKRNGKWQYGKHTQPEGKRHAKLRKVRKTKIQST